jgi:acetylornithine deacetylase/succinyl-diaminopimelate desuccinylase-like protein
MGHHGHGGTPLWPCQIGDSYTHAGIPARYGTLDRIRLRNQPAFAGNSLRTSQNRPKRGAHKKSPCGWGSDPQRANDVGSLRKPDFNVGIRDNQILLAFPRKKIRNRSPDPVRGRSARLGYTLAMYFCPIDLLQKLLAIPSVNPQFDAAENSWLGEGNLTTFLQETVTALGWRWLRQEVHPGRENLVALVPSSSGSRSGVTLWEVHQDTVGVEGMRIGPFAGERRNDRIYGRGACDVKGGMAAMIAALSQAAEAGSLRGMHLLAFTVNEECGFTGAKALAHLWADANQLGRLFEASREDSQEQVSGTLSIEELQNLRPARAMVAEPTELSVVVAHKGIVRWRCHTRGLAAHSSQPHLGRNAIYAMTEVIGAIRAYNAEILAAQAADGLCGPATVSVNTIRGGMGANVVPDHATIDIDRRLLPSEDPTSARAELIDYIAAHVLAEVLVEHDPPWNQSRGLQAGENRVWAEQVAAVVGSTGSQPGLVGVPYGTNAWVYAAVGIPTVVFGPGSIVQAHTDDEWISVEQMERGVAAYRRIAEQI